jgi:hypothetical protein
MADSNYTLKMTLDEATQIRIGLSARHRGLIAEAQEFISNKQKVPEALAKDIDDTERVLRRI